MIRNFVKSIIPAVFCLIALTVALNAQSNRLEGLYNGTADAASYGKIAVSAEIYVDNEGVTGRLITPLGDLKIVEGGKKGNEVSLKFDLSGTDLFYKGTYQSDGIIRGSLTSATLTGTLELKRVGDAPDYSLKYVQSKEKWREDLRFMTQEIARKHKNAFHRVSKEEFEKASAALDARIPDLDDEQIMLGMARVAALVGDGHTSFPWNWEYPRRLPLRFFWFGKDLRVTRASREYARLSGARVLSINGTKTEDLFERARAYIAQGESPQFVLDESQYLLRFPAFLKQVGIQNNRAADGALIEAVDLKGKKFTQTVRVDSGDAKIDYVVPYRSAPLYLQNEDEPLSFQYIKEADAVYVNFRSYPRRQDFADFAKKLFDFIDRHRIRKLIIDLRFNGGGNFKVGRELLVDPIKERKNVRSPARLYVLTGRKTFSAAMVNADDLKKIGAVLVGEPTGARPNNYGEVRTSTLPNSHIPVRYSTEYYKFSDRDVPALAPDILIEPDWKSFLAGKDKVLEWILKN